MQLLRLGTPRGPSSMCSGNVDIVHLKSGLSVEALHFRRRHSNVSISGTRQRQAGGRSGSLSLQIQTDVKTDAITVFIAADVQRIQDWSMWSKCLTMCLHMCIFVCCACSVQTSTSCSSGFINRSYEGALLTFMVFICVIDLLLLTIIQ